MERQKIIIKDEANFQLPIDEEDTFSRLQASSVTYRFATGKSKGKKALVLKTISDGDHNSKSGLVVASSGFSLHAGVACLADEREKLERICRYIARPAIAENRLFTNATGEVIYKFKKPWDDGTVAIRLTPLELMERLAALVPRPRVHLTRFHGVLGPHYKYRKQIVPKQKIKQIVPVPQFPKGMADAVTGAMQTAVSALPSLNSFTLPTAQAAPSAPPTNQVEKGKLHSWLWDFYLLIGIQTLTFVPKSDVTVTGFCPTGQAGSGGGGGGGSAAPLNCLLCFEFIF